MGISEAGVEVKGDFILTPNVPAAAAPGDEFLVSVGVFNNTTGGNGPIRVEVKPSAGLAVVGAGSVDLQIPEKREGVGEFRIRANAVLGSAALTFVASRAAAQSQNEETISVRPPVAYRTQLTLGRVDGASATAPLTRDMYPERRRVEASISAVPLVWGRGLTAYLEGYEYSCTEQLASQGVGGLILTARPEFGSVRSRDAQPLEAAFAMLRSRQNDQGGFGLWSSSPATAEFPTVYAAHVLVEARDKGHKIPDEVLTKLNGWLTQFAATPASSLPEGRLRAYAVYLLVRQGIKPDAAIANVEQELTRRYPQTWPTDLAAAYLASTYRLMQRTNDADRIIRLVPWSTTKRDLAEETYYDAVVHDAQLMYLLARHFPARLGQAPPAALETISRAISGNHVTSLSAAYTLLALDAFAQATAGNVKLSITEMNKDGSERALTLPSGAMPKVSIPTSAARLQFSKDGPVPAYYAINESGFERNPPSAKLNDGIEIIHEFVDAGGRPLTRATVGQDLFVRVRIRATNRDYVPQVAVVDLLPGGIEPVTESQPPPDTSTAAVDPALMRRRAAVATLPLGVAERSDWIPTHVDVREDRVVMYGDVTKDAATFTYRARATNAGTFQAPPAFAEGMYNRTVTGLSLAGKLEIVKP
jgi:alpha-2-macroglobulin